MQNRLDSNRIKQHFRIKKLALMKLILNYVSSSKSLWFIVKSQRDLDLAELHAQKL
jgi:hypothetical protein